MDLHRTRRGSTLRATLILTVVILLTVAGLTLGMDRICHHYLSQRLPLYPDAQVRVRIHSFLSEFGMGNTVITMVSPDPPETVRSWYAAHTGALLREWARTAPPLYTVAQGRADVSLADDGVGSVIILFGTCAG